MNKNTAYSSLCKLNIYFLLKLQKWFRLEQWEFIFLFCCLINVNDRQQEYKTAVTLRAAWIKYTVTRVFFLSCLLTLAKMGILTPTCVCVKAYKATKITLWAPSSHAHAWNVLRNLHIAINACTYSGMSSLLLFKGLKWIVFKPPCLK